MCFSNFIGFGQSFTKAPVDWGLKALGWIEHASALGLSHCSWIQKLLPETAGRQRHRLPYGTAETVMGKHGVNMSG